MGRVWSASSWSGFFDVSAMAGSLSRSLSSLWPSLLDLPSSSSSSSSSQWWWWWRPPTFDLQLDIAVLDSVVWPVVVAIESVALASMLCFFFLFCGCNI